MAEARTARHVSEPNFDQEVFYWADVEGPKDLPYLNQHVFNGKHSYFGKLLTKKLTKIINLPVFKNTGNAISMATKNIGYGAVCNTNRLHQPLFLDVCVEVPAFWPVRDKMVLNVTDGLRVPVRRRPGQERQVRLHRQPAVFRLRPVRPGHGLPQPDRGQAQGDGRRGQREPPLHRVPALRRAAGAGDRRPGQDRACQGLTGRGGEEPGDRSPSMAVLARASSSSPPSPVPRVGRGSDPGGTRRAARLRGPRAGVRRRVGQGRTAPDVHRPGPLQPDRRRGRALPRVRVRQAAPPGLRPRQGGADPQRLRDGKRRVRPGRLPDEDGQRDAVPRGRGPQLRRRGPDDHRQGPIFRPGRQPRGSRPLRERRPRPWPTPSWPASRTSPPGRRSTSCPPKAGSPGPSASSAGPYGLQPYFTFGEGDILSAWAAGLFGALAEYRMPGGAVFTRLIVPYPDPATAAAALAHLRANLDPYIKVTGDRPDGFDFVDFQAKKGTVARSGAVLDLPVQQRG
ncbi:MAG: hypothetical protein MZU91_11030 [Desulfosudis oleivorans]|nr:hypothetical protein [Desulfosudis oleivorans]